MASTYTTGFGIEKIGTGEQAGAWGTTTNHNADILDRIASYKAVALSGTTHTLTVREASPGSGTENLQDGMYRVIKFTGALGGNNTVTIAPNTSPAYFIIENATTDSGSSGPYSVILTQGSGANVTVQNGKNAIIYCDGAGSGAVVYNALADIQVGTLEVTGVAAIDGALTAAAISATTLTASGIASIDDATDTTSGTTGSIHTDGGLGVAKNLFVATNATVSGTTLMTGVATHGDDVVSDTDSTDDLGTTSVRWANLFVDAITATDQITATGFTGTLDGILGSGTPAAATVTTIDASGVATATTFEPDGDTSAGDNAAMGYTSVLGAILTGQGSTNDVTLVNDADATVLGIPTGTTNVAITGDITANNFAGKNRIINGDFAIWQRGTSFSPVANAQVYTADRFFMNRNGVSEWTVARQGTNEQYSCRVQRNASTTSTQAMRVRQVLESANCGGIVGETVTFSCEIKVGANFSAASGYVTLTISQGSGNDESSGTMATGFTGVVNTSSSKVPTTSFVKYSVTTPVIGATISQLGVLIEATPVGTAGANDWYEIRNLQVEVGTAATEFEQRPYGTELALCQRYYEKSFDQGTAPASSSGQTGAFEFTQVVGASAAQYNPTCQYKVKKRAAATVTFYNWNAAGSQAVNVATGGVSTSLTVRANGDNSFSSTLTTPAGTSAGTSMSFAWTADAEL